MVALKFTTAPDDILDIFTNSVGRLKTRVFAEGLLHGIPASGVSDVMPALHGN